MNAGRATAGDVISLIRLVRDEVERRFGVRLQLEIRLVGNWGDCGAEVQV